MGGWSFLVIDSGLLFSHGGDLHREGGCRKREVCYKADSGHGPLYLLNGQEPEAPLVLAKLEWLLSTSGGE